jgi:AraC-like DNA-binding protein
MRAVPEFTVGLVYHEAIAKPYRVNEWWGPFEWDSWVIDWTSYPGAQWEVKIDGRIRSFIRPVQSWQIYAPHVAYRHMDTRQQHEPIEQLWFYYKLHKQCPPLSTHKLSSIVDTQERLATHVRAMAELQQSGMPGAELIIHGHALTVLGEIMSAARRGNSGSADDPWIIRAPAGSAKGQETLLQQVDRVVTSRIRNVPSLDELAEMLSMSVSSLAHRFKAETGQSAMERVRWLRIREARTLLARRGASVKSVARELKFSSPFHFSKVFHETTGMRANAYIKQTR